MSLSEHETTAPHNPNLVFGKRDLLCSIVRRHAFFYRQDFPARSSYYALRVCNFMVICVYQATSCRVSILSRVRTPWKYHQWKQQLALKIVSSFKKCKIRAPRESTIEDIRISSTDWRIRTTPYVLQNSSMWKYAEEVSFEGYQYRIPSRDSAVKELGHMSLQRTWKAGRHKGINVTLEAFLSYIFIYPFHTHDVTAAILVSQTNETAAMLMLKTNPLGVELFSKVNAFFCCN